MWQVTFLCIGYNFDPSVQATYSSVWEDIQEEEGEIGYENSDSINDGFDWTEILEEDSKLCPGLSLLRINSSIYFMIPMNNSLGLPYLNDHFSPPELRVSFLS